MVCSRCRNPICDCYYDMCPYCELKIGDGRPCKSCVKELLERETIEKYCKKCRSNSTFIECEECGEAAFYCIKCYDDSKISHGKLYTLCGACY